MVAGGVEERGGQLDFERFGALHQVDQGRVAMGASAEQFGRGLRQLGAGLDLVFVGLRRI